MKHYITISAALLLSAVLIFNPAAEAATVGSISVSTGGTSAILIEHYSVEYDLDSTDTNIPHGDVNIATYEISGSVYVNVPVDSYINGWEYVTVVCNALSPSGWTRRGSECSFIPVTSSNYFAGQLKFDSSSDRPIMSVYFDNFYTGNITQLPLGTFTYRVSFSNTATPSNLPDPPTSVSCSIYNGGTGGDCYASPNPNDLGLAGVIQNSIINAINDNSMPFADILQTLIDIRTQDLTAYTAIEQYLIDNDTFNTSLYTWLTTVLEDDFGDLLSDTGYIASLLEYVRTWVYAMNDRDHQWYPVFKTVLDLTNTKLQSIIDLMSETPAEAQSMENAIDAMESKQAAINDYSLPAAGNIIGNANNYVNQGSAGMNLLATILNQPLYILILMTVISLAFVSYLLYGKGV